jgi:uncharacterized RDD family membrane protein YckC
VTTPPGDDEHRIGRPGPSWTGTPDGDARGGSNEAAAAADAADRAVQPPPGPEGFEIAPFWRRLAGFVLDNIAVGIVSTVVAAIFGLSPAQSVIDYVVMLLFQVAYFWVFNSLGWSPGKRVLRMRIVTVEGGVPRAERGFARTVGSLLSTVALLVGYLWALRDAHNRTWHDKMAGTFVVIAPQDESEFDRKP